MKIYLAEISWVYEGAEVLGVFTSKEKAEEQLGIRRVHRGIGLSGKPYKYERGDYAEVVEMELEE